MAAGSAQGARAEARRASVNDTSLKAAATIDSNSARPGATDQKSYNLGRHAPSCGRSTAACRLTAPARSSTARCPESRLARSRRPGPKSADIDQSSRARVRASRAAERMRRPRSCRAERVRRGTRGIVQPRQEVRGFTHEPRLGHEPSWSSDSTPALRGPRVACLLMSLTSCSRRSTDWDRAWPRHPASHRPCCPRRSRGAALRLLLLGNLGLLLVKPSSCSPWPAGRRVDGSGRAWRQRAWRRPPSSGGSTRSRLPPRSAARRRAARRSLPCAVKASAKFRTKSCCSWRGKNRAASEASPTFERRRRPPTAAWRRRRAHRLQRGKRAAAHPRRLRRRRTWKDAARRAARRRSNLSATPPASDSA